MRRNPYKRPISRTRFDYGRKNRRRSSVLFALQLTALFLCGSIIVASSVLLYQYWPGREAVPVSSTLPSVQETALPTESAAPTPVVSKEFLPSNPLIENFFGPLPLVESPEEVRRFEVQGLYIGARSTDFLKATINQFKDTPVNTFVIDLKESNGVLFDSKNETAREAQLIKSNYYLKTIVDLCHENNIKVIGRIVCFKDPDLAVFDPSRSIQDKDGNPLQFKVESNKYFVNPYDIRNWDYNIELALEAVAAGVDEIQLDYVRFPAGGTVSGAEPYFGDPTRTPSKAQVINRFLQTARIRIQEEHGVPVTADVFGIVVSSSYDGQLIGQDWATVGLTGISAVSPMIYPVLYANGTTLNGKTFDKPNSHPHDVVYNALMSGKQATGIPNYTVVRPYLQAWGETYGYPQINAQIRAVYDAGFSEWILWNADASYPTGSYDGAP